jgi:hypothetical protein
LKEWTTSDTRKTPSATNLEEEEIEDAPGNDGNASMPEQVKRPNPWRRKKKKMMMITMKIGSPFQLINMNAETSDVGRSSDFSFKIFFPYSRI